MATPPANNAVAIAAGAYYQQQQQRPWVSDDRDPFIQWLRSEFAAANAIIDSLLHHVQSTGEPGEYERVIGCINHRRVNWGPVLHYQQFFPIGEVVYALEQTKWRGIQQHRPKDGPRLGFSYRHNNRFDGFRERGRYKSGAKKMGDEQVSEVRQSSVVGEKGGENHNSTLPLSIVYFLQI